MDGGHDPDEALLQRVLEWMPRGHVVSARSMAREMGMPFMEMNRVMYKLVQEGRITRSKLGYAEKFYRQSSVGADRPLSGTYIENMRLARARVPGRN